MTQVLDITLKPGRRYHVFYERDRNIEGHFVGAFQTRYEAHYGSGLAFAVDGRIRSVPIAFVKDIKPVRERAAK